MNAGIVIWVLPNTYIHTKVNSVSTYNRVIRTYFYDIE